MAASIKGISYWTDRKIPYVFEDNFPYQSDVIQAMRKWEEAGVWFCQRGNENNYITIKQPIDGGSSSNVGMSGGGQDVFINAGYKAVHELGHALGLIHEHQRSDRNSNITPQWKNIVDGEGNKAFTIEENSKNLTDYDIQSVMHYPAPAKGWQGKPTDQEVWTMRFNANHDTKLGAGNYKNGWENPTSNDRQGLSQIYNAVPGWGNQATESQSWGIDHAPRAVEFAGKIWQVWKGANDDHIWYATFDGNSWTGLSTIPKVGTSRSPTIAVFNGQLYAVWRGVGNDAGIYYATNNGNGWSGQTKIAGIGTSEGPTAIALERDTTNTLWLCWKGAKDDHIWYASFNGSQWTGQNRVQNVGTSTGPVLTVFEKQLYLFWKGVGNDGSIWYSTSLGQGWTGQSQVPFAGTSTTPAAAVFNGKLWLCWKGYGNNEGIWWSTYKYSWSGQACISNVGTSDSPTLATLNSKLWLTWSGVKYDKIWYAAYPSTR